MRKSAPSKILTITLNPALDYATSISRILFNEKLYCGPPRIDPGGGGVNVARVIGKLGGTALAFVVTGGATGQRLLQLLSAEKGLRVAPFYVNGETRFSFAVTEEQTGNQQRFSLPGEALTAAECTKLLAEIKSATPRDGVVVLSGGVAPGLPDDFPQRIQREIKSKTPRFVVDTSKAPLKTLVAAPTEPLYLLRVDRKEASRVAQHPMETLEDSQRFARSLVDRGVAHHVVTGRGSDGSLMVTRDRAYFCHAPEVPVRSKIGAGDALVGATVLSLTRSEPLPQALRWGVAAASATVGTEGTALCDLETATELYDGCTVEELEPLRRST